MFVLDKATGKECGSPNRAAFGVTLSRDEQAVWLGTLVAAA
ncbi:hypothetical protein [Streptomyces sp. NBC_00986]|nr:hypothetical protein OG504_30760 [Streptomyces sp. NBC_00986]